jgi:hypothetical protein
MRDWQAELDELFKQTTALVKSVKLEIEAPRAPPRQMVEPAALPANGGLHTRKLDRLPTSAKSCGSEREEIRKRVASFKAHQQRIIREREAYAASMLMRMKATLSEQS